MGDSKFLGDKLILGANVVVEGNFWPLPFYGVIGGRCRLAIPKQCGDNDKITLWVESLVFAYEPEVIRNGFVLALVYGF